MIFFAVPRFQVLVRFLPEPFLWRWAFGSMYMAEDYIHLSLDSQEEETKRIDYYYDLIMEGSKEERDEVDVSSVVSSVIQLNTVESLSDELRKWNRSLPISHPIPLTSYLSPHTSHLIPLT